MNYAWEVVLQVEKENQNRDTLQFVEASEPSPYIEVSMTDLNMDTLEENKVEINPLYRFEDVFGKLFDKNIEEMRQTREIFFDVCMHYIVQLDLREGLSREDFYCELIANDLEQGKYGALAKRRFSLFTKSEQKLILQSYLHICAF